MRLDVRGTDLGNSRHMGFDVIYGHIGHWGLDVIGAGLGLSDVRDQISEALAWAISAM